MSIAITINLTDEAILEIAKQLKNLDNDAGSIPKSSDVLNEEYLTVKQAAEILVTSEQTIRNHIKSGLLISSKIGKAHKISRTNLSKYVNQAT